MVLSSAAGSSSVPKAAKKDALEEEFTLFDGKNPPQPAESTTQTNTQAKNAIQPTSTQKPKPSTARAPMAPGQLAENVLSRCLQSQAYSPDGCTEQLEFRGKLASQAHWLLNYEDAVSAGEPEFSERWVCYHQERRMEGLLVNEAMKTSGQILLRVESFDSSQDAKNTRSNPSKTNTDQVTTVKVSCFAKAAPYSSLSHLDEVLREKCKEDLQPLLEVLCVSVEVDESCSSAASKRREDRRSARLHGSNTGRNHCQLKSPR